MLRKNSVLSLMLAVLLVLNCAIANAEQNHKITHVVLVWLKQPGNEQQRAAFIKASKQFNQLPGVIHRHVGVVLSSDRSIVDDTFDVGISVTLKNKQALQAYLNNPKHKKILNNQIKPLVNRVVIYDFIDK